MAPQYLAATLRRIERAGGGLATASVARMDEVLPWFRELPADQRAWVMLVAQAGVRSLVEWLRSGRGQAVITTTDLAAVTAHCGNGHVAERRRPARDQHTGLAYATLEPCGRTRPTCCCSTAGG